VPFALAEYNAGRSKALEWVDPDNPGSHLAFVARISYPTTRSYVQEIVAKRDQYQKTMLNSPSYKIEPDAPVPDLPPASSTTTASTNTVPPPATH
jgi:hypothetical protein